MTNCLQSAAPFFKINDHEIGAVCEYEGDPSRLIKAVLEPLGIRFTFLRQSAGGLFLFVCVGRDHLSPAQNQISVEAVEPSGQTVALLISNGSDAQDILAQTVSLSDLSTPEILARLFCRTGTALENFVIGEATRIFADRYPVFEDLCFVDLPTRIQGELLIWSRADNTLAPVAAAKGLNGERDGTWFFLKQPAEGEDILLVAEGALFRLEQHQQSESYFQKSDRLPAIEALGQREGLGQLLARKDASPAAQKCFSALQKQQNLAPAAYAWREDIAVSLADIVPFEDAIFVSGSLRDRDGHVQSVSIRTPYGETLDLTSHMVRSRQAPDRYCALVPVRHPGRHITQLRGQVNLASGTHASLLSPCWSGDLQSARQTILSSLPPAAHTPEIFEAIIGPALEKAYQAYREVPQVAEARSFGPTLEGGPAASLIIPLYKEYSFIKPQLQSFYFDPEFQNAEVIYVLDRPQDAAAVEHLLRGLSRIYPVPVKLLVNSTNYGFAGASNLGAAEARSDLLVFFNSDVVPIQPGWLSAWAAQHRSLERIGASGPRLLYADGSLQHAGLYSEQSLMPWYSNHHYYKGYPGSYPAALQNRDVQGVTGACLMMDAALFKDLEGFCDEYVVGDFEDSDLCLKALAQGRSNLYVGSIALYHFERLSMNQSGDYTKTGAVRYNGWLHTRKWGAALDAAACRWQTGQKDRDPPRPGLESADQWGPEQWDAAQ